MSRLPDGASLLRDLGELDQDTVPAGLLKDHSLKEGVWGKLEVLSGALRFVWAAEASIDQILNAGDVVIIPPEELHHLAPDAEFTLKLQLYKVAPEA